MANDQAPPRRIDCGPAGGGMIGGGAAAAPAPAIVDEQLVEEARLRRPTRPSERDLVTSGLLAGGFLAAAITMAVHVAWARPLSLAAGATLVAGYAVLSRIEFEVGPGWAIPTQLVFVPMLFVLPLPLVPLCVAAGYLIGAAPDYVAGRVHAARALVLLSSSWYAVGPAVVLSLFRTGGVTWRDAPIYVAALAAQFAFDAASSLARERIAFGRSPRAMLPAFAWLWAIDSSLAPAGLAAALSGIGALLIVPPIACLLLFMARDRQARIARSVIVARAYRGAMDESHRDELTGIGNRRKLLSDLERACSDADRVAVFVVYDLNGFKQYNDTFGHPAGDVLLRRLAGKLADAVEGCAGNAYRLGGDEFAILAAPPADAVDGLLDATVDVLYEEGDGFSISSCFGAASIPSEAADPSSALQLADQRLYAKKQASELSRGQPHVALLEALFERDSDLREHVNSVASLAVAVAKRLHVGGDELSELAIAAQLHDVGKIAIPDAVLYKPGELSEEEWALMRQHTAIGQRILSAVPALQKVGAIVRSTHERWDGKGYVDGLAGEAIPLAARIIAVCDAFEAMTGARRYRPAVTTAEAVDELHRCAGGQFDPEVVDAFCAVLRSDRHERRVATAAA